MIRILTAASAACKTAPGPAVRADGPGIADKRGTSGTAPSRPESYVPLYRTWAQFWAHSSASTAVRRRPVAANPRRWRTWADLGGRWSALLESVLGATPREFESRILRYVDPPLPGPGRSWQAAPASVSAAPALICSSSDALKRDPEPGQHEGGDHTRPDHRPVATEADGLAVRRVKGVVAA